MSLVISVDSAFYKDSWQNKKYKLNILEIKMQWIKINELNISGWCWSKTWCFEASETEQDIAKPAHQAEKE